MNSEIWGHGRREAIVIRPKPGKITQRLERKGKVNLWYTSTVYKK